MQIDSYFSHSDDIQSILLKELDAAQKSIFVAVAWFTDTTLFSKLLEKQAQGIQVELIITRHKFNTDSSNYYTLIKNNGGVFIEIGDDYQTMHNKFCIIDHEVLINGSYNWTRKANTSNRENIQILKGASKQVNEFLKEFEAMKEVAGVTSATTTSFNLGKAINYFHLFKAYIAIGDPSKLNPYLHEIKDIPELQKISDLLFQGEYQKGIIEMDLFIAQHNQLLNLSEVERVLLLSQINLLSSQIEVFLAEKGDLTALLNRFNHRCIIELNPMILKVLSLKKKIYEKLKKYGFVDDQYQEAEEDFKKTTEDYQREKEIHIPDLNEVDAKDLKTMYREAVRLCHPDSPKCIFEDKQKAAEVFDALTKANKLNDIERVKSIHQELFLGKTDITSSDYNELVHLRAQLATLKSKYDSLIVEIEILKQSEAYGITQQFDDWDDYFSLQKQLLEEQIQSLNEKYVHHE